MGSRHLDAYHSSEMRALKGKKTGSPLCCGVLGIVGLGRWPGAVLLALDHVSAESLGELVQTTDCGVPPTPGDLLLATELRNCIFNVLPGDPAGVGTPG